MADANMKLANEKQEKRVARTSQSISKTILTALFPLLILGGYCIFLASRALHCLALPLFPRMPC